MPLIQIKYALGHAPMFPPKREGGRLVRFRPMHVLAVAWLACLLTAASLAAGAETDRGWRLEQGVELPSYAVVEPTSTNLNIDTVVLACEQDGLGEDPARVLQLQLYLTDDGPLLPKGARARQLKDDPRAEIAIDGRVFPVSIMFAGDFALLADEQKGTYPDLSQRLLDAMAEGKSMVLRLDVVAEGRGEPAEFDGEAVVDLQASGGAAAIAAVRRCARPAADRLAGLFD